MHVRVVRTKHKGQLREYAQLVQSYRRESDGMPVQRVIASLGHPDLPLVQNMRHALAAARDGKRVALAQQPRHSSVPKPTANLRYLDLAVMLELWREWTLDELFDDILPQGEELVAPRAVVAALVLQRCVDPSSKLSATRWLPDTALVELLALPHSSFNNTRLHRVLDELDRATPRLMAKLPGRYEQRDGAFASLFMDVTDTWFVGNGCELAERGKTKEGSIQRKIGIVLLCNEHGYPLRWDVVHGTQHDSKAMLPMMKAVANVPWVGESPLVCDRAMGHSKHLHDMAATGIRFVTALTKNEFDSYARNLPHAAFADLDPDGGSSWSDGVKAAAQLATQAGLTKVTENLFVNDEGLVDHDAPAEPRPARELHTDVTVHAMSMCRRLEELVAQGRFDGYRAAGRSLGLSSGLVSKYRELRKLSEQQQRDVLDGKVAGHSLNSLIAVARIEPDDERQHAFDALLSAPRSAPKPVERHDAEQAPSQQPLRTRVIVYFNPERFVDERLRAKDKLAQVDAFVDELNEKLAVPRSKLTLRSVAARIDRRLHKDALLDAYDVTITETPCVPRSRLHVKLELKPTEWARRRRYDGFSVLVAHPDLRHTAAQICQLYRQKDAVEKDFQVIKSVLEIRPVYHQTDGKVRAHVTLCMLALLLERTLRRKLRGNDSAARALEVLRTCQLNMYAAKGESPAYTITTPTPEQRKLLRTLRLQQLVDDEVLATRMTPR
jgi:hypothetical protein